ncbi:MAG: hypothetical protein KKA65_02580 [Nanoarchaeota archaeon]|nr:hypothetical protein [Nanoarchaeota archaeon]MBU4456363.1 hypothetical protein [Nanoarchaeota archaeon]
MQQNIYLEFSRNLMEKCGLNEEGIIFSLIPNLDHNLSYLQDSYFHSLENLPNLIEASLAIFHGQKSDISKNSLTFNIIKENSQNLLKNYSQFRSKYNFKAGEIISKDKEVLALAILSHIYLDSFERPLQFFLPHSPFCSGNWLLWDKINYHDFKEKFHQSNELLINKKDIWNIKITEENFKDIIKKRLIKENAFSKPLSHLSMIKAIIVRMAENAAPSINYEIVDYNIRKLFRYLGINEFIRIDREMEFFRRLENNLSKAFEQFSN